MRTRYLWVAAALLLIAGEGRAQMGPAAFSRTAATPTPQVAAAQVEFIREASPYAGWGGAIGAVAGAIYGAVTIHHNKWKPLMVPGDAIIGFSAGIVGGLAVYAVKRSF